MWLFYEGNIQPDHYKMAQSDERWGGSDVEKQANEWVSSWLLADVHTSTASS